LLALFLLALAGGVALLVRQASPQGVEVVLPTPTPVPTLQVYLTGAVGRPGVYTFRPGERLADALEAAGGPAPDADLTQINLAARLQDQDHLHVPRVGEAARLPEVPPGAQRVSRINLNRATAAELEALPGIGPTRAAAIVEYRQRQGEFKTVEDLVKVRGIGPTTLQGLRDLVTVE
jgi:competence protein ComEA